MCKTADSPTASVSLANRLRQHSAKISVCHPLSVHLIFFVLVIPVALCSIDNIQEKLKCQCESVNAGKNVFSSSSVPINMCPVDIIRGIKHVLYSVLVINVVIKSVGPQEVRTDTLI